MLENEWLEACHLIAIKSSMKLNRQLAIVLFKHFIHIL